ncbi:unnamed protein product [Cuscuta campestris]|uniref:Retrotransposon gag domain-containing protein n=1 Tax=Cuscuta campestris TaxID=132261 RepID=A0A484LKT4_9ASTE|nr:unnamed protein product [Cuscuta campestris]
MSEKTSVTGTTSSSPTPHLAFTTILNVKLHVPILLSFSEPNYKKWSRLFLLLIRRFSLGDFLTGKSSPSSADDSEWFQLDTLIQGWILSTVNDEICDLVLSTTNFASELWRAIYNIFHDNKPARVMQLEHQFRTTTKGSLSIAAYCQTLRNLADWLDDVDATIFEQQLVLQVLRGLPDDLRAQTSFLQYQTPPTFLQTRSALLLIEQQRAELGVGSITGDGGTALYADSGGPRWHGSAGCGQSESSSGGGFGQQQQYSRHRGGNGSKVRTTAIGNYKFPTSPPFNLQNILVSPHIIHNLISVRQLTRDNNCSIEFDFTGFSVKDMLTGTVIHRSNNAGPLYPMSQSTAQAQAQVNVVTGMADERKKKKVRGAGKCEKLYKRKREGQPPIELEWERGEPDIYVIPPGGAQHVITVSALRHRAFKTYLRGAYLTEGGEHYSKTPIEPEHWEALSEKNRDIQKKNPYPQYMGRGGYAMLQRELAATSQAQLKKEVTAGTFVPDGHNDVLTRALGTAEHPRRTRGVGSYSGLRKVFKGNMKPRKPEDFASMSQHTPSVAPPYRQCSSRACADFVDFADLTNVDACYLRISDPADYIVAHGSVVPRAPGVVVHGVPLLPHQPPLHTARHGDFSSSKSRPILDVRPTALHSSPVQDVVDRSSYVSFGPRCRELCQWLTRTSDLLTISVILDPESMLYPEEMKLRMHLENIHEFMRWEEVDQTIIIVFLRLLHDHMMEHDITSVGLLCPENMTYVVDFGDHQYLDIALKTYQSRP